MTPKKAFKNNCIQAKSVSQKKLTHSNIEQTRQTSKSPRANILRKISSQNLHSQSPMESALQPKEQMVKLIEKYDFLANLFKQNMLIYRPQRFPKNLLIRYIEEIYSQKFYKNSQELAAANINYNINYKQYFTKYGIHHNLASQNQQNRQNNGFLNQNSVLSDKNKSKKLNFPSFIYKFYFEKFNKNVKQTDQHFINLIASVDYHLQQGTKYVWLEMFESFLTRSCVENQELAFYLFVRSMVEKQLKIQIHNVFSHQNLLDFSSSQHNRLKQNSQSSTKINKNQNILSNQHQLTNINISYNNQNERDEKIPIYNDPKDPLNICLNLQHCYKVSQSVFGTQEKQLISDFLDLVRYNINPESGLINFYDFLSLMIQKYQQLVRADKKIKNLNQSKSQEFLDHFCDSSEQKYIQQNNESLHNQKIDRQNLEQMKKQSDKIKEQFEFTLMNSQYDEKEKNKSFSFLNQSISSNLLIKNNLNNIQQCENFPDPQNNQQFEKKKKLKENKQLSFSNQNSSLTSNYEKSNSTTISQEQNYQNTNEDSKNLIKNKSDKQLVFKEKQQQETLQKQQIEKLLYNQLQIQIQDKTILKLKQFLKLIFSKKDQQLQQISQDKIKSYQQKILCIFSSKISQLIEAIVNQDKIMWLDLLLIDNPTQKQLENVECIEREFKYTQQDLLNQYMEDNKQQLNNNCYNNSQGNKQEINLICFQKIKPQVQQISNKILETQELSHAIGRLIACIKNGITQQTEHNC